MPLPAAPATLSAGHTLTDSDWNNTHSLWYTAMANYVVFKDVAAQVVTKTLTLTPDASYGLDITTGGMRIQSGGLTVTAGGLTVAASGITVTGNSTITGTLTALTGITSTGTAALATITASATLNVTGTSTLGVTNTGALTCTTFAPSGLAQPGQQAAYLRHSGGDAGATPAFNWNNGNVQRWRLTANATPTFSNPVKGAQYALELQQDGTGSRTVTWTGATVVWAGGSAPTLTTTASRKDVITLLCVDAAGSGTYLGAVMGFNYNNTTS